MTNWNGRSIPTTTWGKIRLGGAYLLDYLGDYILDSNGERIITIVEGGDLPMNDWGGRNTINTSWNGRIIP